METDTKPAPPRTLSVPQTPVPQTCFGVLNELGSPLATEQIMDFPPDFSWMANMEILIDSFRYTNKKPETVESRKGIWTTHVPEYTQANKAADPKIALIRGLKTWHMIPFMCSKWWNGKVKYRFMAIKPPRVTGKLLITWYPDEPYDGQGYPTDDLRRSIKKEWDLGQSSDCEIEISAFNVIQARPTWIPRFSFWDSTYVPLASKNRLAKFCSWSVPIPSYHMGTIRVEEAQLLQPGSIFPDSIRILVFMSFHDCEFATQCDPRSYRTHIFGSKKAHNVNYPEGWATPGGR